MLIRREVRAPLLVVAVAALMAGCGGAHSRFEAHMKRGQTYFAAADFTKASVEFRNAMQIAPKDSGARLMAGRAAEKLGRPREAISLYQAVVDAEPQNVEATADLARLLVYGGAAEMAMKVLQPVLATHPESASLLTLRAVARSQLKDRAGAIADAEHAMRLAPSDEEAIEVRAGLFKDAGDLAGATQLVSDAVSRRPSSTALREVLADLYQARGDQSEAEQQLRELVKLSPQEARYRFQLAVFYSRARRLDEAQHVLEDTVKALPKSDEAKLALVDFISTQRARAQGEQVLRDYIAREPDNEDLRLGFGELMERSGAIKEATDTYQEVIRRDGTGPKGLIARDRLAQIAWSQSRYDDARKLIEEVLQKNPHDHDALTLRAQISLAKTDPAVAIADLRAVLRDQPQAIGVRRLLAQAFLANGQPALAEESLRAAMETAPNDTSLRVELAALLKQTQRVDQAISLLEETARSAPTDASVREALARAYLVKRDFPSAATAAKDLMTLRPELASGPYIAGLAAEGLNQPAEALKDYKQALTLEPKAIDALAALAWLDVREGQGAAAVAAVKEVSERDPSAGVLNLLGQLYLEQKNVALANDALTRATKASPNWWVAYRNLALAKLATRDTEGAISAYEGGIKAAPAEQKLIVELALVLERNGRADDAINRYETWFRQNPRAQVIANNLAMLLVTYKSDQKSLDRARDLTSGFDSSSDGNLLDTSGWVYFKRAEYAKALPILERAVERAPDAKQIRYHLGMTELRIGNIDGARSDLETAVSGSTQYLGLDEARTTLAALKARSG